MEVIYKHLITFFKEEPSIEELSNKLFQLGHENEIHGELLDIEFTPNRGDCLSVLGLARDLGVFYTFENKLALTSNFFTTRSRNCLFTGDFSYNFT